MKINTLFQILFLLGCFKGYTSCEEEEEFSQTSTLGEDVCSVDNNTSKCAPYRRPPSPRKSAPKEVCYDHLGCFSNAAPYNNAAGEVPDSPKDMGVEHMVYSRRNKDTPEYANYSDVTSVKNLSNINPSLPLKIVIHGFQSTVKTGWAQDIKDAILDIEDVNVYLVDWRGGTGNFGDGIYIYDQAVSNTRVVAAQVAKVIEQFNVEGMSLADVHLIGHSLGAHMCGEVGKLLNSKVGRITGLDPASPGYEGLDAIVRLDETDGQYVDSIHTDGRNAGGSVEKRILCGGLGTMQASGHLAVYVNGGEGQPGCILEERNPLCMWPWGIRTVEQGSSRMKSEFTLYCSHTRVTKLFVESITSAPCAFTIHKCDSYDLFQNGECLKCPSAGCDVMGYHNKGTSRGKAYLDTNKSKLFCGFHYFVNVTPKNEPEGEVYITAIGTKGRFTHSYTSKVGDRHDIFLSNIDIGDLQTVEITLETNWPMWNPDPVVLRDVIVKSGVTGISFSCLSEEVAIAVDDTIVLKCLRN